MTGPSNPRREHAGIRGRRWETVIVSPGETVVEDDDSDQLTPPPAARRQPADPTRSTEDEVSDRLLTPLPYDTRLRLAAARRIDLLGAWLCDHGRQRAAGWLWRTLRMM